MFQYAFLSSVSKNKESIILFNTKYLFNLLDINLYGKNFENRYIKYIFREILIPLLVKPLSAFNIIGYIKQNIIRTVEGYTIPSDSYTHKKGLLPFTYVETAFFQSESFFEQNIIEHINIRAEHLEGAYDFLSVIPSTYHKVFIHVRRKDYLCETYFGIKNVCLPISYYLNQIKWFEENVSNPYFVFISDDIEFVEREFEKTTPKIISCNSMYVDFAIMTLCKSAIISNSSFSWWGAYLMKNRYKIFSPKYWLGYKSMIESPQGIQPSFADIVEINSINLL